ncbi:LysR substrate-binding domain-containing protein [Sphingomonas sp.]|uniref:LysR substrate-binding domain-containing protein n=1 Tax=Sphingomonas sp. TaxID=28214 RepID=UPI000DB3EE30|nr:LysR substrate-binding domain-containing protein [Sphingomonas sp.]PZU10784.1 MAG: LysR family transcriptional regulator [Sphingomonas sp.]
MELRHLRYFVAVAEELHFSRAAIRLNISQPPLSQQIAALELELGVKLFERSNRTVELTGAGRVFLERARWILAEAEDAAQEARRVDRGIEGKVLIGFMSSVMLFKLGHYLRRFSTEVPNADLVLQQKRSDEQYMAVISGQLDIGFVDLSLGEALATSDTVALDVRPALHERLVLCVAPDHPLAERLSVKAEELKELPFVALSRHSYPASYDKLCRMCAEAGFTPNIRQQVESMPVAIAMAAAGYGVALVPDFDKTMHDVVQARFVPIDEEPFAIIYMVSRLNDRTPLVEKLRDICSLQG